MRTPRQPRVIECKRRPPKVTFLRSARPHQVEVTSAIVRAIKRGIRRMCVQVPTGGGKTYIIITLPEKLEGLVPGDKMLIVVSSVHLVNQTRQAIIQHYGEDRFRIGIEQGDRQASGTDDIIIATYQSLGTLEQLARLESYDPSEFRAVIFDEAHHAGSNCYIRIARFFNKNVFTPAGFELAHSENEYNVPIIGFLATMWRQDPLPLSCVFQENVAWIRTSRLEAEGILCPIELASFSDATREAFRSWATAPEEANSDIDELESAIKNVKPDIEDESEADVEQEDDEEIIEAQKLYEIFLYHGSQPDTRPDGDIETAMMDYKKKTGKTLAKFLATKDFHNLVAHVIAERDTECESTLVFLRSRAHMQSLSALLGDINVELECIDHKTNRQDQVRILEEFKQGKISVLLNCAMLVEGVHIERVDRVILATTIRSWISIIQRIGRARRPAQGKRSAKIISMIQDLKPEDLDREPDLNFCND